MRHDHVMCSPLGSRWPTLVAATTANLPCSGSVKRRLICTGELSVRCRMSVFAAHVNIVVRFWRHHNRQAALLQVREAQVDLQRGTQRQMSYMRI